MAEELLGRIEALGLQPLHMPGSERVVLGALGDERVLGGLRLEGHPMVESVRPIQAPYKLVSRELHPSDTVVQIGGVPFGGEQFRVVACTKEVGRISSVWALIIGIMVKTDSERVDRIIEYFAHVAHDRAGINAA